MSKVKIYLCLSCMDDSRIKDMTKCLRNFIACPFESTHISCYWDLNIWSNANYALQYTNSILRSLTLADNCHIWRNKLEDAGVSGCLNQTCPLIVKIFFRLLLKSEISILVLVVIKFIPKANAPIKAYALTN